jgi:hypothetical protein
MRKRPPNNAAVDVSRPAATVGHQRCRSRAQDPALFDSAVRDHRLVEAAQWDALRGRLLGVLSVLDDRFSQGDAALIHEFIDTGEYGLALEQMADLLADGGVAISEHERAEMLALNDEMNMSDRVPTALATCPGR